MIFSTEMISRPNSSVHALNIWLFLIFLIAPAISADPSPAQQPALSWKISPKFRGKCVTVLPIRAKAVVLSSYARLRREASPLSGPSENTCVNFIRAIRSDQSLLGMSIFPPFIPVQLTLTSPEALALFHPALTTHQLRESHYAPQAAIQPVIRANPSDL